MESIYGNARPELEAVMQTLLNTVTQIRIDMAESQGTDPVEHILGRIKSEDIYR